MVTQVLIIHGQLPFAIKLKQTLERNAPFEVHPFTSLESAVDYLQDRVQDVALVDVSAAETSVAALIQDLRAVQSDLALIITPRLNDEQLRQLDVQGTLDADFNARDLMQVVDAYFRNHSRPSLTSTGSTSRLSRRSADQYEIPKQPDDLPESNSFDHVMLSTVDSRLFDPPIREGDTPQSSDEALAALLGSEPAMPDQDFDEVLNALPADSPEDEPPRTAFSELVNSMRPETPHRPLPSRPQFVDFMLSGGMDSLIDEIEHHQQDQADDDSEPSRTFERLAQEEPPLPAFEEAGTISDLITGVHEKSFHNVLSILRGEDVVEESEQQPVAPPTHADFEIDERPKPKPPLRQLSQFDFGDDEPTPAKVILQRTLEQSMTGEFSLEELLANIDRQLPAHRPKVLPLPSWLRESKRPEDPYIISEPEFLRRALPPDLPEAIPYEPTPVENPSEDIYPDQTTQPARGQQIEAHPENLETEWLEQQPRSRGDTVLYPPPETLPEAIPADATVVHQDVQLEPEWDEAEAQLESDAEVWDSWAEPEFAAEAPDAESGWYDLESKDFNTQFELMAAFEVVDEEMGMTSPSGALYTEVSVEEAPQPEQDPYIAQLALSLTDASLETTAEAVLLTRNQQIVAYSGQMPEEEIEELREVIADDWDAQPGGGRIRFVTAQGSGTDYMLYSRRTEDDLTLSLIFAGTTPLRDIRRQGQRLINALLSVPEASEVSGTLPYVAPPLPAAEPEDAVRAPYACVWLLSDPNASLDQSASQAIIAGLTVQLHEQQWRIHALQVREDHVYLLAEVPGEDPAYQLVRDLKRRSAEIVHAQNATYPADGLWADSYLVVTPGRELDVEEIQEFINFERMS